MKKMIKYIVFVLILIAALIVIPRLAGCKTAKPVAPELTVSLTESGKPFLSWSKVDGAVEYEVWRATSGTNYVKIKTVEGNTLTNVKAKAGTKYYYRVRAIAKDGTKGDFSLIKSVTAKE